jgi:hypothetical protein
LAGLGAAVLQREHTCPVGVGRRWGESAPRAPGWPRCSSGCCAAGTHRKSPWRHRTGSVRRGRPVRDRIRRSRKPGWGSRRRPGFARPPWPGASGFSSAIGCEETDAPQTIMTGIWSPLLMKIIPSPPGGGRGSG